MNYMVVYVEGCISKVKNFKTYKNALKFAQKHEKLRVKEYSDDWAEGIIKGKVIKTYDLGSYLKGKK